MAAPAKRAEHAAQTSRSVLEATLGDYHPRDFAIRFWDGTMWEPEPGQLANFTITLRHPGALRAMFLPPNELALGEAYIYDDFDIEGDIEAVFRAVDFVSAQHHTRLQQAQIAAQLLSLPREHATGNERPEVARVDAHLRGMRHSKARDQEAVRYHYDRPNDFYALWLDPRMIYSCAYFRSADEDLATAQTNKLDYICRKLRLKPGDRLLDIGCGWGGLVMYAAEHYGVEALGITLSPNQVALAQERIRAAGLADRCRVELRDYRELDAHESFDKMVSVGMFEHVGSDLLSTYFEQAYRLLKPGGVFLNHGIALGANRPPLPRDGFVGKYVFPDGELEEIHVTLAAAESANFEVRDVESLREHYALTLHHWVKNLESHAAEARRLTNETTYRIWRLYMAGSRWSFLTGLNTIYQTLLVKPEKGNSHLPLTREDWYETVPHMGGTL